MLLGNIKNREILSKNVLSGHLHHCLIFEGPTGIGRKDTAYWLAKIVNCENPTESSLSGHMILEPCQDCWQCRMITSKEHPDIIEINHDPEKKSQIISIRQVNELIENMHYHMSQAKNRVVIFEPFEDINNTAANALLKTLEEPPNNTYFVLICKSAHQLLITIRSRSQRLRFVPLTSMIEKKIVRQNIRTCIEMEMGLTELPSQQKSVKKSTGGAGKSKRSSSETHIDFQDEEQILYCIEKILRLSDGCPQRAYRLTENHLEEFFLIEQLKMHLLRAMGGTQSQRHEFIKGNAQHLSYLLDLLDQFIRDLLYFHSISHQLITEGEVPMSCSVVDIFLEKNFEQHLYQFDSLDTISRWSTKVNYGKIWRFYERIQQARYSSTINVNARLLLDGLLSEFEAMLIKSGY